MEWLNYVSVAALGVQFGAIGFTVYQAIAQMGRINEHYDNIAKQYQALGAAQKEWKIIQDVTAAQNDMLAPQQKNKLTVN